MADLTHEAADRELTELFSLFDEVVASEELMNSTLDAIFSQMSDGEEDSERTATESSDRRQVTDQLVAAPSTAPAMREADELPPAESAQPTSVGPIVETGKPELDVIDGGSRAAGRSSARRRGIRLRFAAAIVAVSIVAAGGVAYAVPATHVQITEGDTTVELGINVFGRTVSAAADSDEGREVLSELDVYHRGFDEAFGLIIDKMGQRGEGDGSVNVQIESPFERQRDNLDSDATRIIDDRGFERGDGHKATGGTNPASPAAENHTPTTGESGGAASTSSAPSPTGGVRRTDVGDGTQTPSSSPTGVPTTGTVAQDEGSAQPQAGTGVPDASPSPNGSSGSQETTGGPGGNASRTTYDEPRVNGGGGSVPDGNSGNGTGANGGERQGTGAGAEAQSEGSPIAAAPQQTQGTNAREPSTDGSRVERGQIGGASMPQPQAISQQN